MLVIKEYGFSAAIGIKVILDFADSNEFSSYLSVSVLALIFIFIFLNFRCILCLKTCSDFVISL